MQRRGQSERRNGAITGIVQTMPRRPSVRPFVTRRGEHGNVYAPNVNVVEEMTDMISGSRAYQDNVEVLNTSKDLMLATLKLGS